MLMNLKNFTLYSPQIDEQKQLAETFNIQFLRSQDWQDWYECQKQFNAKTFKIIYDQNQVICSVTQDVSALYPHNFSVAEVEQIPAGMDSPPHWQLIDGKVVPRTYKREEKIERAQAQKMQLTDQTNDIITPLQDAMDLDMATEAEKSKLTQWQQYLNLLGAVDITNDSIDWPKAPTSDA